MEVLEQTDYEVTYEIEKPIPSKTITVYKSC